jgi:hypothetical protein
MRTRSLLLYCTLFAACNNGTGTDRPTLDLTWEGEVRILTGDTLFTPCGTTTKFRLTGPGLDSIAQRYGYLVTVPEQWIKTWCSGHLAAGPGGGPDSVLVATRYMHMDPAAYCAPVPNDSMSGSYVAVSTNSAATRTEQLILLPNGDATITTTGMGGLHSELDGHWGLNSDGNLVFVEVQARFMLLFKWDQGNVVRMQPDGRTGEVYAREGVADRLQGTYGRTARWLAAVSTELGDPLRAEDLRPSMPLDSLFPDPASRAALRASAGDTLGMNEQKLNTVWAKADNVQKVNMLMRMHLRAAR